jgi:hypothetical protein
MVYNLLMKLKGAIFIKEPLHRPPSAESLAEFSSPPKTQNDTTSFDGAYYSDEMGGNAGFDYSFSSEGAPLANSTPSKAPVTRRSLSGEGTLHEDVGEGNALHAISEIKATGEAQGVIADVPPAATDALAAFRLLIPQLSAREKEYDPMRRFCIQHNPPPANDPISKLLNELTTRERAVALALITIGMDWGISERQTVMKSVEAKEEATIWNLYDTNMVHLDITRIICAAVGRCTCIRERTNKNSLTI